MEIRNVAYTHLLFLLIFLIRARSTVAYTAPEQCFYRCMAQCIAATGQVRSVFDTCGPSCQRYNDTKLCSSANVSCWQACDDLGPGDLVTTPTRLSASKDVTGAINLQWIPTTTANYYILQYKYSNDTDWTEDQQTLNCLAFMDDYQAPNAPNCESPEVRVAAVSAQGISNFTNSIQLPVPSPVFGNTTLLVNYLRYLDKPFVSDVFRSNGTVQLSMTFAPLEWAIGMPDIVVEPFFHLFSCGKNDDGSVLPLPEFTMGPNKNELVSEMPAEYMYQDCRFAYFLSQAKSLICGTTTTLDSPPNGQIDSLEIDCNTVDDSPCSTVTFPAPICGRTAPGNITPIWANGKVPDHDEQFAINYTVNLARNVPLFNYIIAYFGPAVGYGADQAEFLGVNLQNVSEVVTDCLRFDNSTGNCLQRTPNNTLLIEGMNWDTEYGIVICGVRDPRNTTIPNLFSDRKAERPRAEAIELDYKDYEKSHTGLIVGLVVGFLVLAILAMIIGCCFYTKKQNKQNKLYALKLAQMEREKHEGRYTEMPKKADIWEIERRNLLVDTENKLGAGAFGAVYLGKLLGKSMNHHDANSPLGINLLRAENCDVAVKMLPEYADDMSKSEFLQEIALMKSMGYHERLVNMLACVTESEPYYLVVEYCNDGNLLQFLQERCKYMIKLAENNINFHEPTEDDVYDEGMILTMKQLLMFSVQVSYGLEYLSQKGFVHRDVAARNILVSNRTEVKIGDFGLTRYIYSESSQYVSKGGRLPLKWMSPEAIRHYEFSTKSDVWSFGVLLFEVITLGGSPYPCIQPADMLDFLEKGGRMEQPDNCPDEYYDIMNDCWQLNPASRPDFSAIRQKLASQLEEVTEEYSYLQLDARKDYYNFGYTDRSNKVDTVVIPEHEVVLTDAPEQVKSRLNSEELATDETTISFGITLIK
ncbi:unnamed protein product, partial [Mesorhabditis spiculigera]